MSNWRNDSCRANTLKINEGSASGRRGRFIFTTFLSDELLFAGITWRINSYCLWFTD